MDSFEYIADAFLIELDFGFPRHIQLKFEKECDAIEESDLDKKSKVIKLLELTKEYIEKYGD